MVCIVRNFLSSAEQPYCLITHQPDDMPEFLVGKPKATVQEVKEIAERNQTGGDFFWDLPDPAENEAVKGIICVKRFVDLRNANSALLQRISDAAGGAIRGPIEMATLSPGGLFAWIESESDVARVCVASGGKVYLRRPLGGQNSLDWGYEGCRALRLRWYQERLIVVSSERAVFIRSIDPMTGQETGFYLNRDWVIDNDLLSWLGDERGLAHTAALPSLERGLPLPFGQHAKMLDLHIRLQMSGGKLHINYSARGGYVIETLALPSPAQREALVKQGAPLTQELLHGLRTRLFAETLLPRTGPLLIESLAYPFFLCEARVFREALLETKWRPHPGWFLVYWHRYLLSTGRRDEAAELLQVLERVAAPLHEEAPTIGWRAEWEPWQAWLELAVIHVRRQARVVGDVCRSGELPEGTWCLLFDPAPGSTKTGSRVDPSRFPPNLRRAFEELCVSPVARIGK